MVYWYVFHSSVPLHMQSVTDVTATQEPPSRELILCWWYFTLYTPRTVHTPNFCLHGVCVTVAHYYAMLHVTMYTSNNTFPFTLQSLAERASPLPLGHQQSGQDG